MASEKKSESKQDTPAYSTTPGNYNRASGRKTLMFVGIIILLIVILSGIWLWQLVQQAPQSSQQKTYPSQNKP